MINKSQFYFFVFSVVFFVNNLFANNNSDVRFTENKTQWQSNILYRAQLDGGALFLEKNVLTYHFYDKEKLRSQHIRNTNSQAKSSISNVANIDDRISTAFFKVIFKDASKGTVISASQPSEDYNNYFIGSNPSCWASNVKNYAKLTYQGIYDNIDFEAIGMENSIKYNFIVDRGGDPNKIQLKYEGVDLISLEEGKLKIHTSVTDVVEQEPFAYQWIGGKKVNIPCSFKLESQTVSFDFGSGYNHSYQLIIDPTLIFASYSGSLADNFGMTATYDSQGHLYSGGTCFNIGYPVTSGVFDTKYNGIVVEGRTDVVITKYSPDGTNLIYSTYIGGAAGTEIVTSLIVNSHDELLLYGATGSNDFPVTSNAYDKTFNGGKYLSFFYNGTKFANGTDIYVSKLNATGSVMLASTFIGGSENDGVNYNNDTTFLGTFNFNGTPTMVYEHAADSLQYNYGDQYRGEITLDNTGNCYIASSTRSFDFPVVNGFDNTLGGLQDAVILKLNSDFSQLIWSSYLGGSDNDAGYSLVVDDSSIVYVTGGTRSTNFPATKGAYQTSYGGGKADGYMTKINETGTGIIASSYLGTNQYDQSYFIQRDQISDIYVYGQTLGNFPVFPSGVYSNSNSGQFINKFDNGLSTLIYATVFGSGSNKIDISPSAFLVDACENVYISGWGGGLISPNNTITDNMPITSNAFQASSGDGHNFYLMVLQKNLTKLLYGTYFGGIDSREHVDGGTSRFDKKGIVYQSVCAGCGGNSDFPTTAGAWSQINKSSNCNNGVFKFDFEIKLTTSSFSSAGLTGCNPFTVQFNNSSILGTSYLWDFGNNDTSSTVLNPIKTYTASGTYLVKLIVSDTSTCNRIDSSFKSIVVSEPPLSDFDYNVVPCTNGVLFFDSSKVTNGTINSWQWSFGDGNTSSVKNPVHTFPSPSNYDVTLVTGTLGGCSDTAIMQVTFPLAQPFVISKDTVICIGDTNVQLFASGGIAYKWTPSNTLSNASIFNPIASPTASTTYSLTITAILNNGDTCDYLATVNVVLPGLTNNSFTVTSDRDTIFKTQSTVLHISPKNYRYSWLPNTNLDNSLSADPIASPLKTTTYTVNIVDKFGCNYQQDITVTVLPNYCSEPDIFVPNTFTPDDDGKNDVFLVRGNNIKGIYFAVYNRWGEKVFETNDKTSGWNGIYKDEKLSSGVFAYYVKIICFNDEEYIKKGNVTLVR